MLVVCGQFTHIPLFNIVTETNEMYLSVNHVIYRTVCFLFKKCRIGPQKSVLFSQEATAFEFSVETT
jgi:hypothetical protein